MAKSHDDRPRVIDHQKRVVLPNKVLRTLGVDPGDFVAFEIQDGEVKLRRVRWLVERGGKGVKP